MAWYSLPTRREISIILFSLTIFVLFYNLESSFRQLRALQGWVAQGVSKESGSAAGVNWEEELYGDWTLEELEVAKNAEARHQEFVNNSTSLWGSRAQASTNSHPEIYGTVGVNDGYVHWGEELPTTTVVKHVPGSTILDHVFLLNGTVYLVTDDPSFPPVGAIASSTEEPIEVPQPSDWQVLSTEKGREILGQYGGLIHGVTWLCTDAQPSNYTLFSLWRTYSSLNTSLDAADPLVLSPPRRIFYPNIPTLIGPRPEMIAPVLPRQRSPSGFHPYLPKAAFPTLGLMFREDWQDFASMQAPFLLRRVVVSDAGAARRYKNDVPPFAVPLVQLPASKHWWEPIRRNVAAFLGVDHEMKKSWIGSQKVVITYLSRQDDPVGLKLRESDHEALVDMLYKLGKNYVVNVVHASTPWTERMTAILQSTVVISTHGNHLADSVFMTPSSRSTLLEIFPPDMLSRDAELSVKSLGIRYVAWWHDKPYDTKSIATPPTRANSSEIPVEITALEKAIRNI
ncbi:hypothetical protein BKA82DRAFT_992367 [Pisolithus tinctorius]|uniref:Glycosyltransferase family 61 protein n=1 Tax=Pisolithus tinctorius Marx 270 TaxID=870435 RepID=A0A0C3JY89_PISTI|nr:hypothetical protein BKA82DRAFT_992367 [Pisolithus tinctorius]KIO14118.1 hypothetical protein M404DRAFT_992367 [Pisolithus tinctorius Marx 270]